MRTCSFEAGERIFGEGEPSRLTYRIRTGSVDIVIGLRDGGQRKVGSLGADEIFGEMGIIDAGPRTASAYAREETVCEAYDPDEVMALLRSDPKEAVEMIRALIIRLRAANRKLAARPTPGAEPAAD